MTSARDAQNLTTGSALARWPRSRREQEGEDHNCSASLRHGVDDARRKDVLQDRAEGGLCLRHGGFSGAAVNWNAGAGAHQVDGGQPPETTPGCDDLEIEDGFAANAAHAFHVAAARDAHHQGPEQQRAMMERISCRNTRLTGESCLAKPARRSLGPRPQPSPMKIQAVSERRFTARPI